MFSKWSSVYVSIPWSTHGLSFQSKTKWQNHSLFLWWCSNFALYLSWYIMLSCCRNFALAFVLSLYEWREVKTTRQWSLPDSIVTYNNYERNTHTTMYKINILYIHIYTFPLLVGRGPRGRVTGTKYKLYLWDQRKCHRFIILWQY